MIIVDRYWLFINAMDSFWIAFKNRENKPMANSYLVSGLHLLYDTFRIV